MCKDFLKFLFLTLKTFGCKYLKIQGQESKFKENENILTRPSITALFVFNPKMLAPLALNTQSFSDQARLHPPIPIPSSSRLQNSTIHFLSLSFPIKVGSFLSLWLLPANPS